MGTMQSELSKYKDDAQELHSLRAELHSLSDILTRKVNFLYEIVEEVYKYFLTDLIKFKLFYLCFTGACHWWNIM